MLKHILSHKRFSLFAPFIGLAVLTLVAFVFWHMAATRIAERIEAAGMSWQKIERQGFPARITLDVTAPRWRRDAKLWHSDGLSITTMPFQSGHAIIDFTAAHHIETDSGKLRLAHQGNLMSLVADSAGLLRVSFEAQAPEISGIWQSRQIEARADSLGLHTRRDTSKPDSNRHDVALVLKNLTSADSNRILSHFDLAGSAPTDFFTDGPKTGQLLILDRLTAQSDGVTLIARGRVKLRQDGRLDGTLDLDIVNLSGFIDALVAAGRIDPRNRQKFLLLGGLGAALGGDTQDRLSLPLSLIDGRMRLGPLDLGAAPTWR